MAAHRRRVRPDASRCSARASVGAMRQHGSMGPVCLGVEYDGLTLGVVRPADDGLPWLSATLRGSGLHAALDAVTPHYVYVFDDLIDFLDGLARDWRGWSGERVYESLDHDLRLVAVHDGYVFIVVTLKHGDGWRVTSTVSVEPGEQMTRVAAGMRELLSQPGE